MLDNIDEGYTEKTLHVRGLFSDGYNGEGEGVTARTEGVHFFAVSGDFDGDIESDVKNALEDHNIPPEDIIEVQGMYVEEVTHYEVED